MGNPNYVAQLFCTLLLFLQKNCYCVSYTIAFPPAIYVAFSRGQNKGHTLEITRKDSDFPLGKDQKPWAFKDIRGLLL